MIEGSQPSNGAASRRIRPLRLALAGAAVLGFGALASRSALPVATSTVTPPPAAQVAELALPADPVREALPPLEARALDLLRDALREAVPPAAALDTPVPEAPVPEAPVSPFVEQAPPPAVSPLAQQVVPLPVARPPELRGPRLADRPGRRTRSVAAAAPSPQEDTRSFFDKLFGVEQSATPALAYAAIETPSADMSPRKRLLAVPTPAPAAVPAPTLTPNPQAGAGTAVYDISARTVTLPNGQVLEAHSGLGASMDDPRSVDQRMRGATPPGTYELTEREALFHGVRAIRLNPIGGSGAVYGRAGLLAHTYMLGASGASNGCVSFRDYETFLQAFLRGEVQRLAVVSGRKMDTLPSIASKLFGIRTADASN